MTMMMLSSAVAVLLLLGAVLDSSLAHPSPKSVSLATFNTALLDLLPALDARQAAVTALLAASDADVICLQEVWFEKTLRDLVGTLAPNYPYSFSFLHTQGDSPTLETGGPEQSSCDVATLVAVSTCAVAQCLSKPEVTSFLLCMFSNCTTETTNISPACMACIIFSCLDPAATAIETLQCMADQLDPNVGNCKSNMTDAPATLGLLLLSKKEILSAQAVPLDVGPHGTLAPSLTFPRGYLRANIKGISGSVSCTHLSTDPGLFPPGVYLDFDFSPSFEARNLEEVKKIKEDLGDDVNAILMGDMNAGPPDDEEPPAYVGFYAENYHELTHGEHAFRTTYEDACTWCEDNPWIPPPEVSPTGRHNSLIDHIMFRKDSRCYSSRFAKRVFDQPVIPTAESWPNPVLPVSDHRGVQVTLVHGSGSSCSKGGKGANGGKGGKGAKGGGGGKGRR